MASMTSLVNVEKSLAAMKIAIAKAGHCGAMG